MKRSSVQNRLTARVLSSVSMPLYAVTYDIDVNHKDKYAPLLEKLRDIEAKEILDSVWIYAHPGSLMANPIAVDLKTHLLRPGDRLLVIEVGQDAGCTDLLTMTANDLLSWLRQARF